MKQIVSHIHSVSNISG